MNQYPNPVGRTRADSVILTLRLTRGEAIALARAAKESGVSRSEYVRRYGVSWATEPKAPSGSRQPRAAKP